MTSYKWSVCLMQFTRYNHNFMKKLQLFHTPLRTADDADSSEIHVPASYLSVKIRESEQ